MMTFSYFNAWLDGYLMAKNNHKLPLNDDDFKYIYKIYASVDNISPSRRRKFTETLESILNNHRACK